MIGSKFSRHFFNQSEVKPKPIVARACTFSRALCRLSAITSSFHWFTGLSPSFLIGQSNYFGFGFTTLIWKPVYRLDCNWLKLSVPRELRDKFVNSYSVVFLLCVPRCERNPLFGEICVLETRSIRTLFEYAQVVIDKYSDKLIRLKTHLLREFLTSKLRCPKVSLPLPPPFSPPSPLHL